MLGAVGKNINISAHSKVDDKVVAIFSCNISASGTVTKTVNYNDKDLYLKNAEVVDTDEKTFSEQIKTYLA